MKYKWGEAKWGDAKWEIRKLSSSTGSWLITNRYNGGSVVVAGSYSAAIKVWNICVATHAPGPKQMCYVDVIKD